MTWKTLTPAQRLCALYNNSRPLGLGFIHFTREDMTLDEAQNLVKENSYFDYLRGRVMKIDVSSDEFNPALYDRDNGKGAAQLALEAFAKTIKAKP